MKYRELPPVASFSQHRKGYCPDEVQAFQQLINLCWQENTQTYQNLLEQLEQQQKENQQVSAFRQQWHRVLLTAQETADGIVNQARDQAEDIIYQAQLQAEEMLRAAQQDREQQHQQVQRWKKQQLRHERQVELLRDNIRQSLQRVQDWLKQTEPPTPLIPESVSLQVLREEEDSRSNQMA